MLYAPTDVQSIVIPDGCGESHGIKAGAQLIIECGPCEAAMSTTHQHLGWATTPENVTPTCDERLQAERDEASAQKAGIARLNSYANGGDGSTSGALTALVEQNTALMAQNAAMMQQIAGLTVQLASGPAIQPAQASTETPAVVVEPADVAQAEKPTARKSGRQPNSAKAK